jgi:putative mycofactocin binding protein MftB
LPAQFSPAVPPAPSSGLDRRGRYELDPDVGLRDERFGALAYHYGNRRLTFLNDRRLVDVVRRLSASADLETALSAAGVGEEQRAAYSVALARLVAAEVIRERRN